MTSATTASTMVLTSPTALPSAMSVWGRLVAIEKLPGFREVHLDSSISIGPAAVTIDPGGEFALPEGTIINRTCDELDLPGTPSDACHVLADVTADGVIESLFVLLISNNEGPETRFYTTGRVA